MVRKPRKSKRRMRVRINLENLSAFIFKEDEQFVAIMPSLDLTTCGDTLEDAQEMAHEAAILFIEECIRMKTLDAVLASLGWRKEATLGWVPPPFIAHHALALPNRDYAH